jgi:hypothetical protein
MSSTVTYHGKANNNGVWPPQLVPNTEIAGTVTGISSARPFSVQLFSGSNLNTPIYSSGAAMQPAAFNNPAGINSDTYSITGLSAAFTEGLFLAVCGSGGMHAGPGYVPTDASGSDLIFTFE